MVGFQCGKGKCVCLWVQDIMKYKWFVSLNYSLLMAANTAYLSFDLNLVFIFLFNE